MIPVADGGVTPVTGIVFFLAAILWLGMLLIGGVNRKIILLLFVAGLAYVLTFINGVAPISKYQTSEGFWNGVFAISQQLNWWSAASWAIFSSAVLKQKSWALPLSIFAASLSIIAGYPMAIHNMQNGEPLLHVFTRTDDEHHYAHRHPSAQHAETDYNLAKGIKKKSRRRTCILQRLFDTALNFGSAPTASAIASTSTTAWTTSAWTAVATSATIAASPASAQDFVKAILVEI